MPVDRARYGSNWKKVSLTIRRIAGNRCEFCGIANGVALPSGRKGRVILTVAHLGVDYLGRPGSGNPHEKHDVRRENLRALCQKCHLTYDIDEHVANARKTRLRKLQAQRAASGQLELL